MAGFEIVVRPVVFPDIRPAPARSLPPADDPTKGICKITGKGSHPLSLSTSTSVSMSKSKPRETERRVDEVRVYQMDDNGKVTRGNFVDLEIANRIKMKDAGRNDTPISSKPGDINIPGGSAGSKGNSYEIAMYYARQIEAANIEIRKRDQIIKSEKGD
jgi:hypothetical protein